MASNRLAKIIVPAGIALAGLFFITNRVDAAYCGVNNSRDSSVCDADECCADDGYCASINSRLCDGTGGQGYCGDGACNNGETDTSCPSDCGGSYCGDGSCNGDEDASNCSTDCGSVNDNCRLPICGSPDRCDRTIDCRPDGCRGSAPSPDCECRSAVVCTCTGGECAINDYCCNAACEEYTESCDYWWQCPRNPSSSLSSSSSSAPTTSSPPSPPPPSPPPSPPPPPGEPQCSEATTVVVDSGIGIEKTVRGVVDEDGILAFEITVSNSGPDTIYGYRVVDQMADFTEFVSSNPAICEQTDTQEVTCISDQVLEPGEKSVIEFNVRVLPGLPPDTSEINTACVENPITEKLDCAPAEIPALVISKTSDQDTVDDWDLLTYEMRVENIGLATAEGFVRVIDTLPESTEFDSSNPDICSVIETGEVACISDVVLEPGESYSFDFTVRVLPGLPEGETLVNTACVENPITKVLDCDEEDTDIKEGNEPPTCGDGTAGSTITVPHVLRVNEDDRTVSVTGLAADPDNDYLTFDNWRVTDDDPFGRIEETGEQTALYSAPPGGDWVDELRGSPETVNLAFEVTDGNYEPISCYGDVVVTYCDNPDDPNADCTCSCLTDGTCDEQFEEVDQCGVMCDACSKPTYSVYYDPDATDPDTGEPLECSTGSFNSCHANNDCTCGPGEAWFQTVGGDIHANYQELIGSSLICNIHDNDEVLSLTSDEAAGPGILPSMDQGVVSGSSGAIKLNLGTVSTIGWEIGSYLEPGTPRRIYLEPGSGEPLYDYDYFRERYAEAGTTTDLSDALAGGDIYVHPGGDLTIDSPITIGAGRAAVIFIPAGDLIINAPVKVEETAFLLFVVKRDIYVSSELGGTVEDPDLEGIYIAQRRFITESAGVGADTQLFAAGTFVSYGGFKLNRILDDNSEPAEIFIYRPDLTVNTPKPLTEKDFVWYTDPL